MRLLALPPLPQELLEQLFGDPRLEVVLPRVRTQEAVEELLPGIDLVLGDWSPQLRINDPGARVAFVQQPSVGVDRVDVEACAERGVPVANCAGANATSVAEWCLGATLALLRKTVEADQAVRRGEWPQTTLGGRELAGQRVGVVGMGAAGRATATLFTAVGCRVSYWSRRQHSDAPVPYLPLDELLTTSDVVILVIALGDATRGLLDRERLLSMKQGAVLVNGARGEIVESEGLVAAVGDRHITVAADVFPVEPLPEDSRLRRLSGVLLSPHMAGSTVEAALRIVDRSRANLLRALEGTPVVDVVNAVDPLVRPR